MRTQQEWTKQHPTNSSGSDWEKRNYTGLLYKERRRAALQGKKKQGKKTERWEEETFTDSVQPSGELSKYHKNKMWLRRFSAMGRSAPQAAGKHASTRQMGGPRRAHCRREWRICIRIMSAITHTFILEERQKNNKKPLTTTFTSCDSNVSANGGATPRGRRIPSSWHHSEATGTLEI